MLMQHRERPFPAARFVSLSFACLTVNEVGAVNGSTSPCSNGLYTHPASHSPVLSPKPDFFMFLFCNRRDVAWPL